ncbi:hypothetical protein [Sphingomonas sp. Leaf28]|uniref:hypothetical protein n=1 Tax=Sphingomonas sp. Leaf28 TaxID=1735695 RepID=UPI000AD3D451|nr:hypothetical protein [Sphingomonas sp. Leaf28]
MFAVAKSVAPAALDRVDGIRIGNLIEALFGLLNQAAGDPDSEDGDLDRGTAGEDGPIAEARARFPVAECSVTGTGFPNRRLRSDR